MEEADGGGSQDLRNVPFGAVVQALIQGGHTFHDIFHRQQVSSEGILFPYGGYGLDQFWELAVHVRKDGLRQQIEVAEAVALGAGAAFSKEGPKALERLRDQWQKNESPS